MSYQPIQDPQPVTGPLTDSQLRATAVPVSGPLTDTELRASAVPVDASGTTVPVSDAGTYATTSTTGAAGTATVTITVPAGKKWILKAVTVVLVTDVNVATRKDLSILVADASANPICQVYSAYSDGTGQAASLTGQYSFAPGLPDMTTAISNKTTTPYPELALDQNFTITATLDSGIQVGDTIQLVANYVEY